MTGCSALRHILRAQGRAGASLQEAIDCSSFQNGFRSLGLIHGMIAKHVRQHLGVEDAARRRHEGTEILLAVESISQANALGGEMRG
jgi:hypothetical protein